MVKSINKEYIDNTDIPFTDFNFNVEDCWKRDLKEEERTSIKQLVVTKTLNFKDHRLIESSNEYVLFLKGVLDEST